jgi:hypothetical protein
MPRLFPCRLILAAALVALAAASASGALKPELLGEGVLLGSTTLPEGYAIGVYGPEEAGTDEAVSLTVLVMGNETARISAGAVFMAAGRDDVALSESQGPGAEYVPAGEWSPERESGWRQLLQVSPKSFWSTHLAAFAPVTFSDTTGHLLDHVLLDPSRPRPADASPFRDLGGYTQMGAALLLQETLPADPKPGAEPEAAPPQAYAFRVRFHAVVRRPEAAFSFWVCVVSWPQGTSRVATLAAPLKPVRGERPPLVVVPDAPIVWEPAEGAAVGERLRVTGLSRPGALTVAWIEVRDPARPDRVLNEPPQRYRQFADVSGNYGLELTLPKPLNPTAAALRYELHVRAEAPGFPAHPDQTKDTVIPLTVVP